jgi:diacylglycerol O-acyltransferase
MHPVGLLDQIFFWLERENQPTHIGAVVVLAPPSDAPSYVEDVRAVLRSASTPVAPFNRRVVRLLGGWFWEEVSTIDVDAHVRLHELPEGSTEDTVHREVSRLHRYPLDPDKPLWELHVFLGLANGRVAIYLKVHHALADGITVSRLLARALSPNAEDRSFTPFWALAPKERGPAAAKRLLPRLAEIRTGATAPLRAVPKLFDELRRTFADRDGVTPFDAPRSILNQRIGAERRFTATRWKIDRLRAASSALGITLNDLLLAMCSSALRRYLLERGALPKDPLVAMVPVTLRKEEVAEGGNSLTMMLADLATEVPDVDARLAATLDSVNIAKERVARLTGPENIAFVGATIAPALFNLATGLVPESQAFNLVISNVPGPKEPLFLAGARVEHVVPVSLALHGQALNVTFGSYTDYLEVGIIACARSLPDIDALIPYLHTALSELEALPERTFPCRAA